MVSTYYDKSKHSKLRCKFNSSEIIEKNYSDSYQDLFVLTMLNGKKDGFYLEIGAGNATNGNNTYLLESQLNWKGISVEQDKIHAESFQKHRRNVLVLSDALTVDYRKLLAGLGCGKQIDYLTLDIDPYQNTFECLKKLPLDEYRFSVITYETDYYHKSFGYPDAEQVKIESRRILSSYGYEMIVGNIAFNEDWYVDPRVVDRKIIQIMKDSPEYNIAPEEYILLPPETYLDFCF